MTLFYDTLIEKIRNMLNDIKSCYPDLESVGGRKLDKRLAYRMIFSLTVSSVFLSGVHRIFMEPFWAAMEYEEERADAWDERERVRMEKGLPSELEGKQRGKMKLTGEVPTEMELEPLHKIKADTRALKTPRPKKGGEKE